MNHARAVRPRETKAEAYVALRYASRLAGCRLRGLWDRPRVQIDQRTIYEPDGAIVCGPKLPDSAIFVNLIVVVEVLSPSTAAIDHGRKLSGYFSLPSIRHYLILDPERRVVIHHKRGVGDAIETRVLTDGVARLDPPDFEVAVEALFPLA